MMKTIIMIIIIIFIIITGAWAASAANSRRRHGGPPHRGLLSCGCCAAYTAATADVDPDDGCGRTTRQGRTVAAPAAAAAAPAPAAAHPVAGTRPTWPAHLSAHGPHVSARGEYRESVGYPARSAVVGRGADVKNEKSISKMNKNSTAADHLRRGRYYCVLPFRIFLQRIHSVTTGQNVLVKRPGELWLVLDWSGRVVYSTSVLMNSNLFL